MERIDEIVQPEFIFQTNKENWCIKIRKDGIQFNKKYYSDSSPDDFAKAFIEILEKNYTVKFEKRK
jgi:putative NADH-flavin reductase